MTSDASIKLDLLDQGLPFGKVHSMGLTEDIEKSARLPRVCSSLFEIGDKGILKLQMPLCCPKTALDPLELFLED